MKLTRHNGRAGKNGAYNPKHNDRRFDVENSEHIDPVRTRKNIYWDCYQGLSSEAVGEGKTKYVEQVKNVARQSLKDKLRVNKEEVDRREAERKQTGLTPRKKQNMEL